MSANHTAVHEAGHAFFFFYGGDPITDIRIWPEPCMGPDEWEGETNPGDTTALDASYVLLSALAGGMAEAKFRLEEARGRKVRFNHENDEAAFVSGRVTHPGSGPGDPGRTVKSFLVASRGQS